MDNNENFLKRNPLDILSTLRNLHKQNTPLLICSSGSQFISKILSVTPENLVIDFSGTPEDSSAAQKKTNNLITAESHGAKVEFILPTLQLINYLSLPAFTAPLPQVLSLVQRREYFRINAPVQASYCCRTEFADGTPFIFQLCDLSLGGMGALLEGTVPDELHEGLCFKEVELDLENFGKFSLNMKLITISERKIINRKNETVITPRLSFCFQGVSPAQERDLQRIIFSLERLAREKANRVR